MWRKRLLTLYQSSGSLIFSLWLCNSVSFLLVMRPTTVKSSANSTVILLGCLAKPSRVLSVYSSGQNVEPWWIPCVDYCGVGQTVIHLIELGPICQEVQHLVERDIFRTK